MAEAVAQEVDGAPLPGRADHLRDRGLQPLVRIRDDELEVGELTPQERAQEVAPEGLRLARPDVERQDFAPAGLVYAVGDDQRLALDAAARAHLLTLASSQR